MKKHETFMKIAIKEAEKNIRSMTGGPFGACIVKNGKVVAVACNTVLKNDATCHAEVNAIRKASKKLRTFDLSGTTIYTTTEPCPMCFSAIHWARIKCIVYGSTIKDAARAGFNEMPISNKVMRRLGKCRIELIPGVLKDECVNLFQYWQKKHKGLKY